MKFNPLQFILAASQLWYISSVSAAPSKCKQPSEKPPSYYIHSGVFINIDSNTFYTGTLISPRHILTSGAVAEIVKQGMEETQENSGIAYVNEMGHKIVLEPVSTQYLDGFAGSTNGKDKPNYTETLDVGIINIKDIPGFDPMERAIIIDREVKPDEEGIIAGWDISGGTNITESSQRFTSVSLADEDRCTKAFPSQDFADGTLTCILSKDGNSGAKAGDIGAGLFRYEDQFLRMAGYLSANELNESFKTDGTNQGDARVVLAYPHLDDISKLTGLSVDYLTGKEHYIDGDQANDSQSEST